MSNRMFDAFVFDVDGTLADTFPLIINAFNEFARKYTGREWTLDELTSKFGPTETEIVGNNVAPHLRHEAVEFYYEAYEKLHSGVPLYDGISELLGILKKRGAKLAIFTGKGKRSALITLKKLDILDLFDCVITGDDVANTKPSPEGIYKIFRSIGVDPKRTAMIGDHPADIVSGREAGAYTVAALWHGYYNKKLASTEPDISFENPRDMIIWIDEIFAAKSIN